jgi:hypothetical protein
MILFEFLCHVVQQRTARPDGQIRLPDFVFTESSSPDCGPSFLQKGGQQQGRNDAIKQQLESGLVICEFHCAAGLEIAYGELEES